MHIKSNLLSLFTWLPLTDSLIWAIAETSNLLTLLLPFHLLSSSRKKKVFLRYIRSCHLPDKNIFSSFLLQLENIPHVLPWRSRLSAWSAYCFHLQPHFIPLPACVLGTEPSFLFSEHIKHLPTSCSELYTFLFPFPRMLFALAHDAAGFFLFRVSA